MGDIEYYLGICFNWRHESDGHISVHLSQEGYTNAFIDEMGLQNAVSSPKMTPYRSGLPIDSIPKQQSTISNPENEKLQSKFRSLMGMLNWLSISTCPDLTMVHSLLASATESPSRAHLEALRHVGRYVKANTDYGISFSSHSNAALESFVEFPLDDINLKPHPTALCQLGSPGRLDPLQLKHVHH
jgi:hypothetical protein